MEMLPWVHGEKIQHHRVWNVLAGLAATIILLLQLEFENNSRLIFVHLREKFHGSIIMYTVLVINIALHNCIILSSEQCV